MLTQSGVLIPQLPGGSSPLLPLPGFFHIPFSSVSSSFAFLSLFSSLGLLRTQRNSESASLTFQPLAFLHKFLSLWAASDAGDYCPGTRTGEGGVVRVLLLTRVGNIQGTDEYTEVLSSHNVCVVVILLLLFQLMVKLTLAPLKFTLPTT